MPHTNARKDEIRSQYREAMRFEQSPRPAPSTLTPEKRAYCRVRIPVLIGLYAQAAVASLQRGRLRSDEFHEIERKLANWDRCTPAELDALGKRINELHGLFNADLDLSVCSAELR